MQPNPTFIEQLQHGFMPILASEHGKDVDFFILIIQYLIQIQFLIYRITVFLYFFIR